MAGYGGWRGPWVVQWRPRRAEPARRARRRGRRSRRSRTTRFCPTPHGALVAADGSVDWLCIPFDSPSVFGSLLDREAGRFQFGPYGIEHPRSRAYAPGTNVLETTYRTPSPGWLVVRDALSIGPRPPRRRDHAPPAAADRR